LHGRQDLPDLVPLYLGFDDMPLVSISNDQRRPVPKANFAATVYHGLPVDLHRPTASRGDYVAFLGRISPEKRPDRAIQIAARAGLPLKIAAKVDNVDRAYWDTVIAPLVARYDNVEFVGEIDEGRKASFLGNARALLFPIDWPEPFGLVMIEAMACGTPVIAWNRGSVPEVIDDGVTGFIVDDEMEAVAAIRRLAMLERIRVRRAFEQRFTVERMAMDYLSVYRGLPGVRRDAARLRRMGGDGQSLQAVA
jgi:glycosyltransferase involved in cell wall biosynthesis